MKKYLLNILIIVLFIFPSILIAQKGDELEKRAGIFVVRKGRAEIGYQSEFNRFIYESELESREFVGSNNVIAVKDDSQGELFTKEGETLISEKTTLRIDNFNTEELNMDLMHGIIDSNFSNVEKNFNIEINANPLKIKTKKNVIFRMRSDKKELTGGILVKSGYVWAFDRENEDVCVIVRKGQSIIIPNDGSIFSAKLSEGMHIMKGCIEKFEDDHVEDDSEDVKPVFKVFD